MGSMPPKRPNRRLKKASLMSFRKLPPLPPTAEEVKNHEISISDSSQVLVNVDSLPSDLLPEAKAVRHRKWVKLRTEYGLDNFSATGLVFRVYCDHPIENEGCEVQEMSTWIEGIQYNFPIWNFNRKRIEFLN